MSRRNKIRVREIMTDKFKMMDGMATVRDGLDVMVSSDTDALIVNKRTEDDAYGIVLLSDIARKVLSKNQSRSRTNLYEIMSKPVLAVEPDLDIRYCAQLFDRFGLSLAPVLEEGQVIGVISYQEIVLEGLAKFET